MSTTYSKIILVLIVIGLSACKSDESVSQLEICNKDDIKSPRLISVYDAAQLMLSNDQVIPVEISKSVEYQSGHISDAVNVWRPDFRSKKFSTFQGMICDREEIQSFLEKLGATNSSHLLLYDNKGGCDAMRLSWVFDCYGLSNYQVINGGKTAWRLAGYGLDTASHTPIKSSDYKVSRSLDSTLYANMDDVLDAIKDPNTIIVDTRESYEFLAQPFISNGKIWAHKNGAYARGAIPGAIHLNWSDLSDLADDHRIKCTKDLIFNLEAKGITKDKKVIVYCQSGSRSSHTAFILREILGYPDVKNYDGSWIEWSYHHINGNKVPITKLTSYLEYKDLYIKLREELNQTRKK